MRRFLLMLFGFHFITLPSLLSRTCATRLYKPDCCSKRMSWRKGRDSGLKPFFACSPEKYFVLFWLRGASPNPALFCYAKSRVQTPDQIKTSPDGNVLIWRKGRDSNPRNHCWLTAFRERPVKPLLHLSVAHLILQFQRRPVERRLVCRTMTNSTVSSARPASPYAAACPSGVAD